MSAAQVASQVRTSGCYKCGKQGHLARDCTAPRSEWIKRPNAPAASGTQSQTGAPPLDDDAAAEDAVIRDVAAAEPEPTAAKAKRSKPKVTLELLKKPSGLPDVYHNFPTVFQKQCKGRGHEASDLRRLLEMYKRWQDRIYPGAQFDGFIADIEKLSNSNVVKRDLHEMRMHLVKVAQDQMADDEEEEQDQNDAPNAAAAAGNEFADEGELMALDVDDAIDDDELLQLAAQELEADNNAEANKQPTGEVEDDELLQMLEMEEAEIEAEQNAGEQPGRNGVSQGVDADDDELIALACEQMEEDGLV